MDDDPKIPVVLRGLKVMEAIALSGNASCVDIADKLHFPKSTIHRILQQLTDLHYLQKNPINSNFSLAMKAHELAHNVLGNDCFYAPRHEILKSLSLEVNETCNCTIQDGFEIVYYDRVESNWPIRIQLPIGSKLPMYCTASGKLFLSFMPKSKRQQFFHTVQLVQHSKNTIVAIGALEQELRTIHTQQVAYDREEFIAGMVSMAVPVFHKKGKIAYTIAIHAPSIRTDIAALEQKLPVLRHAATKMEELFTAPNLEE